MERVIARLEPLLREERIRRMQAVLATRSDHVSFVFERMIDPHNLSAALRSLDAFSFQDVHLVHPGDRLAVARGITIGAERWLSLHQTPRMEDCLHGLKGAGYTVYASHPGGEDATPLTEIDFSRRTALVFGNERLGVGAEALAAAQGRFWIGTTGFAQSLNLSVAVALSAFQARQEIDRLAATDGNPARFALAHERQRSLYAQWLRQSVKNADVILEQAEST